jgi:hypothetical protein
MQPYATSFISVNGQAMARVEFVVLGNSGACVATAQGDAHHVHNITLRFLHDNTHHSITPTQQSRTFEAEYKDIH